MIKKIPLLLFGLFIITASSANPIDETTAVIVARNFLSNKAQQFSIAYSSSGIGNVGSLKQGETLAYAINFLNGGYVIVAAEDASKPILAYSFQGTFDIDNTPPVVQEWMQIYYNKIGDLRRNGITATPEISQEWIDLLEGNYTGERDNRDISPLLSTTWDQGARYNELCPEDDAGPGGHVWSGCVATAMSQVMNYWRYPLTGTGSHGYYSDYGYLSVNFGSSSYDYEQMNASIGGENNYEMAEIQYHCGVAVDMMYSPSGSGAFSEDAADALRTYFGYASNLSLEYKEDYSESDWCELLIENLESGNPMYYHGFGTGGHAFNVDGYQGTDYFHFNWGWSGSYNGYYYLNNLNPGGNDFTYGQGAIVNFVPNPDNYPYYCTGVKTLTRHNGTIEDGSGPIENYIGGLSCGWLIAPDDSVSGLTLIFDKFDLAAGDVVNIFDGPNSSAPLIGSYTGNTLPSNIVPASGNIYLEFLTSGSAGKGWKAHYVSTLANYCDGVDTYTAPSGTFADGSGTRDYRNNSVCKYIIDPDNAATITITFDLLDTETGHDKVKIYDMISQEFITEVSGNQLPGNITVPSGKAYILFASNNSVTGPGWQISYTSTVTDVKNISTGNLSIFSTPNPANDWLRTEIRSQVPENVTINLVSADGKQHLIFDELVNTETKIVMSDVSKFNPGMYTLRYQSNTSSGSMKIIIQ